MRSSCSATWPRSQTATSTFPIRLHPTFDWELSARVDFGVDPKQEILAMTSPRRRMARLVEVLETALEALQAEQLLRERAGRNGKVTPLDPDV